MGARLHIEKAKFFSLVFLRLEQSIELYVELG